MTDFPQPEISDTNRPFWEGLKDGRLLFQTCARGHRWLPARDFCPTCLTDDIAFTPASGRGRVVSWVIYRTAFHPAFEDRVPYNVALVELDEGPRLMTNVLCAAEALADGLPVRLKIEFESELAVARFEPVGDAR